MPEPQASQRESALRSRRVVWAPLGLFVVLGLAVAIAWQASRAEELRSRESQTALMAEQLARRLEEFVEARLLLLEVVRDERLAGLMQDAESFRAQTEFIQREFGGFHAINWIDPGGVIRWIAPEEGNRGALGRNVFEHTMAGSYLRSARYAREPRMTAPLDLFQGGRGVTAYYPEVDEAGRLVGYVNGVFLLTPIVEECLGEAVIASYEVEIRDHDALVYSTSASSEDGSIGGAPQRAVLGLLGRTWSVEVSPRSGVQPALATNSHLSVLVGGLALAIALAFALWLSLARLDQERRSAHERLELEAQVQRSHRMEAVGQLAGGVAHDFNNILTAILGNADLAADSPGLQGKHRAALEQVVVASERAAALTRRLLTFARQQVVHAERLQLNKELDELRPMLERLVRSNVRLHFDLGATRDQVRMDPGQVSQVVMNLILNSVDAMPEGGDLRVSTHDVEESFGGEPGDWVAVTVADTGQGMDEVTCRRALEPFYTTKAVGKGTGLGLSTVYGEVKSAGGDLEITSRVGEGTSIEVRLPRLEEEPPSRSDSDAPKHPETERTCSILLVEDDASVLEVTRKALTVAGYEVHVAEDGAAGLALVDSGARIDVVVTDAVMPGIGGVELIRRLRTRQEDLGAVIMSGYSQDLLLASPATLGVRFLAKPFSSRELFEAIERARRDQRARLDP